MATSNLVTYQMERDALLAQITAALLGDPRLVAAWVGGSLGAGTADALSDLDLWIVVEDEHCRDVYAERSTFVDGVGPAVLHLVAPQNAPLGGAYLLVLYAGSLGALQVDWYWQPRSAASLPQTVQVLFDRVGLPAHEPAPKPEEETGTQVAHKIAFFWAMLGIVAKKIARNDPWTVVAMLRMLAIMLEEIKALLGIRPFPTYKDQPASAIPADSKAQFVMLHALATELEALTPALMGHGVTNPTEAIKSVKALVALIEASQSEVGG